MCQYKMIAVDLDDTLLDDNWQIKAHDRQAVERAKDVGVKIVIATGRMYCAALPYAEELRLDTPIIAYQGAYIRFHQQVLYNQPLPYDLTMDLLTKIVPLGFHVNIYIDDRLLIAKMNDESRIYQEISGVEPVVVGDLIDYMGQNKIASTKILVVAEEAQLDLLAEELRSDFPGKINVSKSKPFFLELMHNEVDKGRALATVAGYYGIKREEVIAVGDSYNDLEMLNYAGLGVAVANAREEIKSKANYITCSNNQGGVARVIDKFILKK